MSKITQELQALLEEFGYVVLNRYEPLEVPSIIQVQLLSDEEWFTVRITERATIEEWVAQCGGSEILLSRELGPYFYKTVAE